MKTRRSYCGPCACPSTRRGPHASTWRHRNSGLCPVGVSRATRTLCLLRAQLPGSSHSLTRALSVTLTVAADSPGGRDGAPGRGPGPGTEGEPRGTGSLRTAPGRVLSRRVQRRLAREHRGAPPPGQHCPARPFCPGYTLEPQAPARAGLRGPGLGRRRAGHTPAAAPSRGARRPSLPSPTCLSPFPSPFLPEVNKNIFFKKRTSKSSGRSVSPPSPVAARGATPRPPPTPGGRFPGRAHPREPRPPTRGRRRTSAPIPRPNQRAAGPPSRPTRRTKARGRRRRPRRDARREGKWG